MIFAEYVCYMVNSYHVSLRCHRSDLVSTEFLEGTDVNVKHNFVEMGDIELSDDDPVQCGSEFCVICNELATELR